VETIEESSIDQSRRPDHSSCKSSGPEVCKRWRCFTWPNQYLAENTCESVPNHLCRYAQQQVETPTKVLSVETSLSCKGVRCISDTSRDIDVRHDDDYGMLFHIEFARVQTERFAENTEFSFGHCIVPGNTKRVCDQLDGERSDGNSRLAQREESIQTRGEGRQEHSKHPGADSVDWDILVVLETIQYREDYKMGILTFRTAARTSGYGEFSMISSTRRSSPAKLCPSVFSSISSSSSSGRLGSHRCFFWI